MFVYTIPDLFASFVLYSFMKELTIVADGKDEKKDVEMAEEEKE